MRSALATMLDVRCREAIDSPSEVGHRCQLLMGHGGPHAVMFSRGHGRVIRVWRGHDPESARELESGFEQLPWMRGYPVPDWTE